MSRETVAKAERLIASGQVRELPGARTFDVAGDHGPYRVTIDPEGQSSCPCKAGHEGIECSHVIAAGIVADQSGAREQAFADAGSALRALLEIVEAEADTDRDVDVANTLHEACDRFDAATQIDEGD